jgi:hypothetical protein
MVIFYATLQRQGLRTYFKANFEGYVLRINLKAKV